MDYCPRDTKLKCKDAENVIKNFASGLNEELILYKGGNIEKEFCEKNGIDAINIEDVGVKKVPYNFLLNMRCLFK